MMRTQIPHSLCPVLVEAVTKTRQIQREKTDHFLMWEVVERVEKVLEEHPGPEIIRWLFWDNILCHNCLSKISHGFLFSSLRTVQFSCSVVSVSLRPHGLQHARFPCPSPTPGAYSNSCPSRRWCHPTILSFVVPFSSRLQSFPASGSFPMSWFFASGGQSIGVSASASVLPMNIQDWFPLGLMGWISLQPKELSRVFSNTTVQKHRTCLRILHFINPFFCWWTFKFSVFCSCEHLCWRHSCISLLIQVCKLQLLEINLDKGLLCHRVPDISLCSIILHSLPCELNPFRIGHQLQFLPLYTFPPLFSFPFMYVCNIRVYWLLYKVHFKNSELFVCFSHCYILSA